MKLLCEFSDEETADRVVDDFRNKGVLAQMFSADSKNLGSFKTGAVKVSVWVVRDEQHEDAVLLLNDSKHVVKEPMSEEEMESLEKEFIIEKDRLAESFTNKALLVAVVLMTVLFIISVKYQAG